METTLLLGDFVYIALIVIIFGGASGYAANYKIKLKPDEVDKKLRAVLVEHFNKET